MNNLVFHDNRHLKRIKGGNEYFAVHIKEYEQNNPLTVALTRYCVPGRLNTYRFEWVPKEEFSGDRVRYCSESHTTLPKALELVTKDLDRIRVVELLKIAAQEEHPGKDLFHLLSTIAPKSKSTGAVKRLRVKLTKSLSQKALAKIAL